MAHPRLAKVLGNFAGRAGWYVASEYIAGVTLFELGEAVAKRNAPLDPGVATRIVLDTLTAVAEAQQLLAATANLHDVRCVFSDSIWIASYGEVFVSEVLIAPFLAGILEPDAAPQSALADLRSAGIELSRLLGFGSLWTDEARAAREHLGPELSEILRGFQNHDSSYQTLAEPIAALNGLGPGFLATEERVSEELQRVLGSVMDRRTQKVTLLERGATQGSDDEQTRYFRVSAPPARRDTTRPPEAATRPPEAATRPPEAVTRPPEAVTRPPEAAELLDGIHELARTDPPGELTAIFGSLAPPDQAEPTAAPPTPAKPPPIDDSGNPISVVWKQARQLLDSSAQRAKQQGRPLPDPARRRVPQPILSRRAAGPVEVGDAHTSAASHGKGTERVITLKIALAVLGLLAVALLVWASMGH